MRNWFSHTLSRTTDRWLIIIKSLFPFPTKSGLQIFPGVIGYDKKNKGPYLCSWFARWWKASSFFPQEYTVSTLNFVFREPQDISDNPMEREFRPAFILTENCHIKRIFLKAKQVGFSLLYQQVKQTCTLHFYWTRKRWTELSSPLSG